MKPATAFEKVGFKKTLLSNLGGQRIWAGGQRIWADTNKKPAQIREVGLLVSAQIRLLVKMGGDFPSAPLPLKNVVHFC